MAAKGSYRWEGEDLKRRTLTADALAEIAEALDDLNKKALKVAA